MSHQSILEILSTKIFRTREELDSDIQNSEIRLNRVEYLNLLNDPDSQPYLEYFSEYVTFQEIPIVIDSDAKDILIKVVDI